MNAINPERPEFTAAIRGYDRLQVDEYIARLQDLVAEAEDRGRAAESELEFSRHSTVGPRVTEIFELAIAEAKELRSKAITDCDRARTDARAEVDRLVSGAREDASAIKEQAQRDREDVLTELAAERRRREEEIERLDETKGTMLAELRRLQEALAAAAGIYGKAEPAEAETEEAETGETQTKGAEIGKAEIGKAAVPVRKRRAA
jgi:cell division septum initiation protein DivIVA